MSSKVSTIIIVGSFLVIAGAIIIYVEQSKKEMKQYINQTMYTHTNLNVQENYDDNTDWINRRLIGFIQPDQQKRA